MKEEKKGKKTKKVEAKTETDDKAEEAGDEKEDGEEEDEDDEEGEPAEEEEPWDEEDSPVQNRMTSLGRMVSPSADFFGDSQAAMSQQRFHGPYFSPVPEEEEQPQPGAPAQQASVPQQA